jgi:hypothetical protein
VTAPTPNPNGCRWCGVDQDTHLQRFAPEAGWHVWAAPSDEQRKQRILARRAGRVGA